jgi:hypothetical protein
VLRAGGFDAALHGTEDLDLNLRIVRQWPSASTIASCSSIASTSRDGLMLREAVTAHKRQRNYVRTHRESESDHWFGLRLARTYFGTKLARTAWIAVRRGEL